MNIIQLNYFRFIVQVIFLVRHRLIHLECHMSLQKKWLQNTEVKIRGQKEIKDKRFICIVYFYHLESLLRSNPFNICNLPNFIKLIENFDIVLVSETKLVKTDTIFVNGYTL
jgi:energy-converting hydrogenase Eha subunit H